LKGKIIVLFWFWKERGLGAFFLPFFLKKVIFDIYSTQKGTKLLVKFFRQNY